MADAFHIVCPACDSVNRVPRSKPARAAKCGQCGANLFPGKPIELGGERFKRHVARNDIPVVVDFWAPWCGPCRVVAPVLEEIASERDDVRIVKLNVDENQQTAAQYEVLSIPTMILFRNGQVATKVVGALPRKRLEAQLEPALTQ